MDNEKPMIGFNEVDRARFQKAKQAAIDELIKATEEQLAGVPNRTLKDAMMRASIAGMASSMFRVIIQASPSRIKQS